MNRNDPVEVRNEYIHEVIAALGVYLKEGSSLTLDSERTGQQLAITFHLEDAGRYQATLESLWNSTARE